MMKPILQFAALSLLVAALASLPMEVLAQNTNKAATPSKAAEKKSAPEKKEPSKNPIPFHGHLLAVNKTAKTIKVDKRIFEITSESKIYKGEKPAALEDGVVGEY